MNKEVSIVKDRLHRPHLRVLAVLLCALITVQTGIAGQQPAVGITILVLEGNGAQNVIFESAGKPISVKIVDRTGRPLAGASVQFVPPSAGPGGEFATNANPILVTADSQGVAVAPPFQANSSPGAYQIQIIASYMGSVARLLLSQTNVVKKKGSSRKMLFITAAIGGAAAAAFAAKGAGGSSTPSPSPTPIPGSTTVPTITFRDSSIVAP